MILNIYIYIAENITPVISRSLLVCTHTLRRKTCNKKGIHTPLQQQEGPTAGPRQYSFICLHSVTYSLCDLEEKYF